MTTLPVIQIDLPSLAGEINDAHRQVQYHAKGMLLEAKRAGEDLLQAKALCRHGEFKAWVEANCRCGYRQASAYMRVAKLSKDVDLRTFDGGIDAFLDAHTPRSVEKPAPTTPVFTKDDAEYVLKIYALVNTGTTIYTSFKGR